MSEQSEQQKFAVLIDGDNAQASLLPQILAEVSKVGLITIKRIYGDWTTVVVKGKCQGLMFSDFVSPTPFLLNN